MTAQDKIKAKLAAQSTSALMEIVKGLFASLEDAADIALNFALDELERRLPEQEFCEFCEAIE